MTLNNSAGFINETLTDFIINCFSLFFFFFYFGLENIRIFQKSEVKLLAERINYASASVRRIDSWSRFRCLFTFPPPWGYLAMAYLSMSFNQLTAAYCIIFFFLHEYEVPYLVVNCRSFYWGTAFGMGHTCAVIDTVIAI